MRKIGYLIPAPSFTPCSYSLFQRYSLFHKTTISCSLNNSGLCKKKKLQYSANTIIVLKIVEVWDIKPWCKDSHHCYLYTNWRRKEKKTPQRQHKNDGTNWDILNIKTSYSKLRLVMIETQLYPKIMRQRTKPRNQSPVNNIDKDPISSSQKVMMW